MTSIEFIVITIIAVLTFGFICNLIRRPSLLFSSYLLLGAVVGAFISPSTQYLVDDVGQVGFIILLFLIGLEIEAPSFSVFRKSFFFCFLWLIFQIPLFVLTSLALGESALTGFVAGTGINACSLGIAYSIIQGQKETIGEESSEHILISAVILEVICLFSLAFADIFFTIGFSEDLGYQFAELIGFILVIWLLSRVIHNQFSRLLENAKKWKHHQLLLILFTIAIIGDRFGLSAPKTAFFLGLFMNATTHRGIKFEDELRPIGHNVLIPIFFISLGTKISFTHLFPYLLPAALLLATVLFTIRYLIFKKWAKLPIANKYFLLLCPNLTMVAIAVEVLEQHIINGKIVDLMLITGFIMTIGAAILFPERKAPDPSSA